MSFRSAHLSATARCGCLSDGTAHLEEAKQAARRSRQLERDRNDGSWNLAWPHPLRRPHPCVPCPSQTACRPANTGAV